MAVAIASESTTLSSCILEHTWASVAVSCKTKEGWSLSDVSLRLSQRGLSKGFVCAFHHPAQPLLAQPLIAKASGRPGNEESRIETGVAGQAFPADPDGSMNRRKGGRGRTMPLAPASGCTEPRLPQRQYFDPQGPAADSWCAFRPSGMFRRFGADSVQYTPSAKQRSLCCR